MGNRVHVGETIRVKGGTTLLARGELSLNGPVSLLVDGGSRGAYDLWGALLPETCRRWGKDGYLPDKVAESTTAEAQSVREDEVIWGGAMVGHYGHFLTESVARLWAVLDGAPKAGAPVVFVTPSGGSTGHDWLAGFGAQYIQLSAGETIRFERVFVPEPAWRLNGWLAPEMRDIHLRARDGIEPTEDEGATRDRRVVWLSRAQQPAAGRPYDEALLEWILKKHVRVVRPETLPLSEQISEVEHCDVLAGIIGSAFHTLLMVRELPTCVYLCPERVRDAFVAQSRMLGATASFVHTLAAADSRKWRKPRPLGAMRVLIPETLRTLMRCGVSELHDDRSVSALLEPERWRENYGGDTITAAITKVCLDPQSIDARLGLGLGFERMGQHDCALEQFRYCVDYAGADPRPSFYAARTLARTGKLEAATAMAEHALELDPALDAAKRFVRET